MQLPAAPATFRELRVRPWGGGLGRRHPGIIRPNRVIFRLKKRLWECQWEVDRKETERPQAQAGGLSLR